MTRPGPSCGGQPGAHQPVALPPERGATFVAVRCDGCGQTVRVHRNWWRVPELVDAAKRAESRRTNHGLKKG